MLISGFVLANDSDINSTSTQVLIFNKWYITQIINNVNPIADDIKSLKLYVDIDTINKLT